MKDSLLLNFRYNSYMRCYILCMFSLNYKLEVKYQNTMHNMLLQKQIQNYIKCILKVQIHRKFYKLGHILYKLCLKYLYMSLKEFKHKYQSKSLHIENLISKISIESYWDQYMFYKRHDNLNIKNLLLTNDK